MELEGMSLDPESQRLIDLMAAANRPTDAAPNAANHAAAAAAARKLQTAMATCAATASVAAAMKDLPGP